MILVFDLFLIFFIFFFVYSALPRGVELYDKSIFNESGANVRWPYFKWTINDT